MRCLSHNAASPDELDLLVGLVNGRISLFSLAALVAPGSPPFATPRESHDAAASGGACLSVSWVPGTAGSSFVSAHADGSVVVHHRLPGNSLDAGLLRRSNSQLCASLRLAPERPGANEAAHTRLAAPSPRGSYVAVAGRDGACTIQHWTSRRRIGAFRVWTWYGGVTCLAWSGDERLVAAGGEDDLVHVYSVPDDSLVAVCRGHASWVAAVAFDPRPGPGAPEEEGGEGQAEYRLASVGDDGRFCVWHLRCSPSQKPRSEAGHIAWAPQRQRRRSELPYAEPSIRTRVSVEPLSDIQLDSEGVVLITNRGGMLSYRRKMAVGPAEPPCQEEDVR
ncbi:hypothetical protein QBZ16_001313 [Prototheca wickerhamii]|uniref:Uncharacterized protein n=1 Tax=Prototheca wickerhamii TaxID=3111 RepID=A0AAD9MGX7_PROWI|nr:hypothetical protein QBZ16_001313 [Prototheca wickerhamii]